MSWLSCMSELSITLKMQGVNTKYVLGNPGLTQFMEWKGPIKEIQVELPGDLHKAVRSKALTEDLRIYQAYTIALEWYLGYTPKVEMPKAFRRPRS